MFSVERLADVAQSVERILGKDEVAGSNPAISSKDQPEMVGLFLCPCTKIVRISRKYRSYTAKPA